MAIIPLFVDTGPTPEEVILQEVGVLREQVNTLHKQMHERFDRIEQMLNQRFNAMYELTQAGFADVNLQLFELRRDVDDIQEDLVNQALKLERMGQSLQKALQDGFRINFFEACNIALNYKAKNQGEPMPRDVYIKWEGTIRTWANQAAKGETEQHVAARSYADDDLLEELEKYPLEENIMYLSNWLEMSVNNDQDNDPVVRHSNTFTDKKSLANPVTWATAAEVYARLRYENPEHSATEAFEGYNDVVERVGQDLREALRGIVVKDTESGPVPDKELFRKLVANYKKKVENFDDAIRQEVEVAYLKAFKDGKTQKLDVDFWADPWQEIPYVPNFTSEPQYTPLPNTMASVVPSLYLLDAYLRSHPSASDPSTEFTVKLSGMYTDVRREYKSSSSTYYDDTGVPTVEVSIWYGDEEIVRRRVAGDSRVRIPLDGYHENLKNLPSEYHPPWSDRYILESYWTKSWFNSRSLLTKFDEGGSYEVPGFTPSHVQTFNRTYAALWTHRRELCRTIAEELDDGGRLYPAVRRLEGAKAILDRFVNLGMPRALETDDFLRAMLYGTQSLVVRPQILERYRATQTYPAQQETGWRWCDKCQGLAWGDEPGACPAGGPHNHDDRWAYTVLHTALSLRAPLSADANARADAFYKPGPDQNNPDQDATGVLAGYLDLVGKKDAEGRWSYREFHPLLDSTIIKLQTTSAVAKVLNKAINADTRPPMVSGTTPARGATGVRRNTNLTATFSEKMDAATINKSTFKLFKVNADGSTTQVTNVTVTPSTDGLKATLNPYGTSTTLLAKNTKYKAVVTTGARDVAGNPLDQDPTKTGNQQKVWYFKTGLQ